MKHSSFEHKPDAPATVAHFEHTLEPLLWSVRDAARLLGMSPPSSVIAGASNGPVGTAPRDATPMPSDNMGSFIPSGADMETKPTRPIASGEDQLNELLNVIGDDPAKYDQRYQPPEVVAAGRSMSSNGGGRKK